VSVGTLPAVARPEARWRFPSARYPGVVHTTIRHADGSWECFCQGYVYAQRVDGLCLHIDAGKASECPLTVLDMLRRGCDDIVVSRPAGRAGVPG
jgi:hypothetical protein